MRELSLKVLDIAQNSITANASLITVEVIEDTVLHTLSIDIIDNGKGMSEEQLLSVRDPFFTTRTTRKVGMGIPLFKLAAEQTGGRFSINSALGKGTVVLALRHTVTHGKPFAVCIVHAESFSLRSRIAKTEVLLRLVFCLRVAHDILE